MNRQKYRLILIALLAVLSFSNIYANTDEWNTLDLFPSGREKMASALLGDRIYFIGGNEEYEQVTRATNSVLAMELDNFSWAEEDLPPDLNYDRIGASAITVDNRIYVIGGKDRNVGGDFIEEIEVWSPEFNDWYIAGTLTQGREGAGVVVKNDTIYVIGGWNGTEYLDSVEWLLTNDVNYLLSNEVAPYSLPVASSNAAAVVLDDSLYVIGGFSHGELDHVFMLQPHGWTSLDPLPFSLQGLGGMGFCKVNYNGQNQVLLLGGIIQGGVDTTLALTMNSDGDFSEYPATLPYGRSYHSLINTGTHLIVAGGSFLTMSQRDLIDEIIAFNLDDTFTSEFEPSGLPDEILVNAWPNPANGAQRITFNSINADQNIEAGIYNILGQKVTGWNLPGSLQKQSVFWNGKSNNSIVPAGIYFFIVEQGDRKEVIKLHRLP